MIKKFLFILFLALLIWGAGSESSFSLANIGEEAPNIKLPDIENDVFELAALKGSKIILNFWASWSEPSLLELIYLEKNYEYFKNKKFTIVSVNLDQRPAIAKFFSERRKLSFPVLVDLKLASLEKYRLLVVPTTFIVDQDFIIREILANFDESVVRKLEKISKY